MFFEQTRFSSRVYQDRRTNSFVSSLTFLRTLLLEVNITDHNKKLPPVKGGMSLYFNRLFLRDRYSVAPDKFGQKQLENAGLHRTVSGVVPRKSEN